MSPSSCLTLFMSVSIVGFVLAQQATTVKDIVNNVRQCYAADKTKFDGCLLTYFKDIRPHLAVGIPELKVLPLDPLDIGSLQLPRGDGIVQGEATFVNMQVLGMGNYSILDMRADVPKQTIIARLQYPTLKVEGQFRFDGNVFLLPIKSSGPMNLRLDDVQATLIAFIERDGPGGLRLVRTDIDFDARDVRFFLDNIVGGNPEVSSALSNLINDNSPNLFRDVKPQVRVKLGDGLTKVLAGAVQQLPTEAFIGA